MEFAKDNERQQASKYEHKVEQRAVKHREICDRNNMTLCRSPTRDLDTRWIKNELHRKRQFEFSKRRPVDHGTHVPLSSVPKPRYMRATLNAQEHMTQTLTSIRRPLITRQNLNLRRDCLNRAKQTDCISSPNDKNDPMLNSVRWDVPGLNSDLVRTKEREKPVLSQDSSQDSKNQKTFLTTSMQTQSGFVTVKEADVQQLADYLEAALHREEVLKKKLASLQKNAATLVRSTELLWKTRCDEDLLKSKIKGLETQLQICIKKAPHDGVKKVVLKMEKQREEYEQISLKAIQRAQNEKADAQSKMEHLQGMLHTTQAESEHWQKLCNELRQGSNQLKQRHDECTDQILQLQGQLERSVEQEEMLRKQTEYLQQETTELHSRLSELEEENLALGEHLQELTGHNQEWLYNNTHTQEDVLMSDQLLRTDNNMIKQSRDTGIILRNKEKECMELQAELEALEQECYSYQSRLTQCKEEINKLITRQNSTRKWACCGSCFIMCLLFLLMVVLVIAVLWLYHPPAREQLRQFYSLLKQFMEDYMIQTTSSQHSACVRPV